MAHLKFTHYYEDLIFYPEGVVTEYKGIAEITHDGDGENIDIVELYVNGEKQHKIFGTDKHWTNFLNCLYEAARRCDDEATQERISMPIDSMWHKLYPAPTRHNLNRSRVGGNAVQIQLHETFNF